MQVLFCVDGERIAPDDPAETLGLVDSDLIDVVVEQDIAKCVTTAERFACLAFSECSELSRADCAPAKKAERGKRLCFLSMGRGGSHPGRRRSLVRATIV